MATDTRSKLLSLFLSRSGYRESDVDGVNVRTRVFTTTNGGKYQILRNGTVRRLYGPPIPKEAE